MRHRQITGGYANVAQQLSESRPAYLRVRTVEPDDEFKRSGHLPAGRTALGPILEAVDGVRGGVGERTLVIIF